MRRFYFGDDEEENTDPDDFDEKFSNGPDFFSMAQFPLDSGNGLLDSSIKICENSIFWKFYNLKTKLNKIKETYNFLIELEKDEDASI